MANLRQTARLAIIVPAELVLVLHVHLDTTAARLPLHKLHAQPHFTAQLALPQAATCVLLASSVQPRPPTPPAHWATTALPVRLPSSSAQQARIALHQLLRLHVSLASTVWLALPLPPHVHLDTTVLLFLQIKYPVV